jgi:hypothetical protein
MLRSLLLQEAEHGMGMAWAGGLSHASDRVTSGAPDDYSRAPQIP